MPGRQAASLSTREEVLQTRPGTPEPDRTPKAPAAPRPPILRLAIPLLGCLLVNTTNVALAFGSASLQTRLGPGADWASWLTSANAMGLLCGVVVAPTLLSTFGLRRVMAIAALLFALAAVGGAAAPALPAAVALRALQGFAAGLFGPIAFFATFVAMGGPRLPYGLALLAFVLVLPGALGPAAGAAAGSGVSGTLLAPSAVGLGVAGAAIAALPRTLVAWPMLRADWSALSMLALALASTVLILGQGGRHGWFESPLVIAMAAICVGAWAGVLATAARPPQPILDIALLARRAFVAPILMHTFFRAGVAGALTLIWSRFRSLPGGGPPDAGGFLLLAAVPQLFAFALAWWLLQRLDGRVVAAAGLAWIAIGALVAGAGGAPEHLQATLILANAGQVLFLVPILIAGARGLAPHEAATASVTFNATTVGGGALGVALATGLGPRDAAPMASSGDGLLLIGAMLLTGALGLYFVPRQAPLAPLRSR